MAPGMAAPPSLQAPALPAQPGMAPAEAADRLESGFKQPAKMKLAPELRDLPKKLAALGGIGGSLRIGRLQIHAGRVAIRVQLTDLSDEVLAKLKKLGFKELGRAKSVKLLIGTIHVSKLEDLARLEEVRRVDPES